MKKLIIYLASIYLSLGMLFAQNTFRISGGMKLVTSGAVQLVLGQTTLTNNGSISGNTGTWVFSSPVTLTGSGTTQVANLTINQSFGVSQLNSPISVTNITNIVSGNLTTNDNLLIRTDINPAASFVVSNTPNGNVQGLVAKTNISAGTCPSFIANLSVNMSGPMLSFQWQTSSDSLTWNNVANATNSTYDATVSGPVFYRCRITSGGTYDDTAKAVKLMLDLPIANISGVNTLPASTTSTLIGTIAGGSWTSNNTPVLTVNASTGFITALKPGNATVTYTVTNGSNCTASATSLIIVNRSLLPSVIITNPAAVCAPTRVDLTIPAVTAGSDTLLTYSYFTDAAATIALATPNQVSVSGTYYIKGVNSANVSSDIMPVVVTINPLPTGTILAGQGNILCGTSSSLSLTATGGNTYAWFKDGTAIAGNTTNLLSVTSAGVYTVNLISALNCVAPVTNTITVINYLAPKASFTFDSYCINKPVTFTSTSTISTSGSINFLWSDNNANSSTSTTPRFTYTTAGNYNVKLRITPQSCPLLADSVTIVVPIEAPTPAVRMAPAVDAYINTFIDLKARSFGKSYLWTPATGLNNPTLATPRAYIPAETEYKIAITVASSCITVDTLLVRVFDNRIYVPNVFSPNGDGINDKLFINLVDVKELRYFRIFNRYAKIVFETNNSTIGWDGKFEGQLQQIDTYVWMAEVIDTGGNRIVQRGTVTLLR